MIKRLISLIIFSAFGFVTGIAPAAGDDAIAEHFAAFDPSSTQVVSDLDWGLFLDVYVVQDEASGINLVEQIGNTNGHSVSKAKYRMAVRQQTPLLGLYVRRWMAWAERRFERSEKAPTTSVGTLSVSQH